MNEKLKKLLIKAILKEIEGYAVCKADYYRDELNAGFNDDLEKQIVELVNDHWPEESSEGYKGNKGNKDSVVEPELTPPWISSTPKPAPENIIAYAAPWPPGEPNKDIF